MVHGCAGRRRIVQADEAGAVGGKAMHVMWMNWLTGPRSEGKRGWPCIAPSGGVIGVV